MNNNKTKFSLESMTKKLSKILEEHMKNLPSAVGLKLPTLKKVGQTPSKIKLPELKKV